MDIAEPRLTRPDAPDGDPCAETHMEAGRSAARATVGSRGDWGLAIGAPVGSRAHWWVAVRAPGLCRWLVVGAHQNHGRKHFSLWTCGESSCGIIDIQFSVVRIDLSV